MKHNIEREISRLAVAETATMISLAACGEGFCKSSQKNKHLALKATEQLVQKELFMQNKPNLYHGLPARGRLISLFNKRPYACVLMTCALVHCSKNKAKQTQFKANFS